MVAPESTVWGDIVTSSEKDTRQGQLGIYLEPQTSTTQVSIRVQVWFRSRYSIEDQNNEFYFDAGTTNATTRIGSVSVNHTSNSSWSTSNQTLCYDYTYTYNRATSNTTASFAAKLSGIDIIGKPVTVSRSYTIPALQTYVVLYWKNDGSGMGYSTQNKQHDQTITLLNGPTRTGYTFSHWNTKADGTGKSYSVGDSYSANDHLTLYAIWTPHTYTVTYVTGANATTVPNQTKKYGVDLTLSGAPTREGYIFQGWSTSSAAVTVTHRPGDKYTQNTAVTFYAVWLLGYKPPRIYNVSVKRCASDGELDDAGTYASVSFDWDSDKTVSSIDVHWAKTGSNVWSGPVNIAASGTSAVGSSIIFGSDDIESEQYLDSEVTYDVRITVTDTSGSSSITRSLFSQKFTIDFVYEKVLDQNGEVESESTGVAFGKTAELTDTVEFAFDAKFNKPVYGKVLGMDRLPRIYSDEDFNDEKYLDPGCYAVHTTEDAKVIANCPIPVAGRLEVWSSTGSGVYPADYSNVRQCYYPYELRHGIVERDIYRYTDGDWIYGDWVFTKSPKVTLFTGSGTTADCGVISLSEHITEFAYVEIYYRDNNDIGGGYSKLTVTDPMTFDLSMIEASSDIATLIRRTRYTISGSQMSPQSGTAGYTRLTNAAAVQHLSPETNHIYITKVVGYYE